MTPFDTSRSLTRRVPIYDSPRVVEYHGPVNSTKLLISRSASTEEAWWYNLKENTLTFIQRQYLRFVVARIPFNKII